MSNERELARKIEALLMRKFGSTSSPAMRMMFDEYDTSRDGKIGRAELERLLTDARVGNTITRRMWVNGVIEKMDGDRDGQITWQEYERAIEAAKRSG
ncbi:MAG: EF-hand domain-containing protein [Sandaracinaceae bacterium]|nr:EF-hand domain-containing protein [Sandaracinaceae bacterium]